MSKIQDEAYTEAMDEILLLKKLNSEERQTIDELSGLVSRLCDALERWQNDTHEDGCPAGDNDQPGPCTCDDTPLILQARESING